jgi:hypothetical protein
MYHESEDHVAVVAVEVGVVNDGGVDGVVSGAGSCLARVGGREIFHRPASVVKLYEADWDAPAQGGHKCDGDMMGENLMEGRMNLESMKGLVGEEGAHEVHGHSSHSPLFLPSLMKRFD